MSTEDSNKKIITIAEARAKIIGTKVQIRGIVILAGEKVFVQDHTAGINLYKKVNGDNFKEGDLIEVEGKIKKRKGLTRIKRYKVKKLSSENPLPEPHNIKIQEIDNKRGDKYESQLVKIKNVKIENINSCIPIKIVDNQGNKLYVVNELDLVNISNGDIVDITGIVYVEDKLKLYVRSERDISKIHPKIIFDFIPGNMTSTFNRTPKICAVLKQGKEFLDLSTAKLYVDHKEVKCVNSENTVSYIPTENLTYGKHNINSVISDTENNVYQFNWYFIIENKDAHYNFYYGVPHSHTSNSDGIGTPLEAYEYAKNRGLDFLIITDHSSGFKDSAKWEMVKIEADEINKKYDDFLALVGMEIRTKFWGHMNVINSIDPISRRTRKKNEELYEWLCTQGNIILSVNHPNRLSENLSYLPELNSFIKLIEVGNGSPPRVYKRMEKYYYDALDKGWYIAPINGQDNHNENWGKTDNLTAVIAEDLSKDSIINSMKARRIYSTETRTLKLVFKANDYWMGSILHMNKEDKLNFQIDVEDKEVSISKIEIISNGGRVIKSKILHDSNRTEWKTSISIIDGYSWYVVKIIHSDGRWGISSPIFVQVK